MGLDEDCDGLADRNLLRGVARLEAEALLRFGLRMRCIPRILVGLNARRGRPLRDEDLEDLAQDVFLIVWRKLDHFDGRSPLEAWVYRTCLFEFSNLLRKDRRRASLFAEAASERRSAGEEREADTESSDEEVQRGLSTLEAEEEAIIRLRHFHDTTFETAAERTGLPASTLKTRYYRGLRKLEDFFRNRGGGSRA